MGGMFWVFSLGHGMGSLIPCSPVRNACHVELSTGRSCVALPLRVGRRVTRAMGSVRFGHCPSPCTSGIYTLFTGCCNIPTRGIATNSNSSRLVSVVVGTFLRGNSAMVALRGSFSVCSFCASIIRYERMPCAGGSSCSMSVSSIVTATGGRGTHVVVFSGPYGPASHIVNHSSIRGLISSISSLIILSRTCVSFSGRDLLSRFGQCSGLVVLGAYSGTVNVTTIHLNFTITGSILAGTVGTIGSPCGMGDMARTVNRIIFDRPRCVSSSMGHLVRTHSSLARQLAPLYERCPSEFGVVPDRAGFVCIRAPRTRGVFACLGRTNVVVHGVDDSELHVATNEGCRGSTITDRVGTCLGKRPRRGIIC